jgi:hypothetical protein
MAYQIYRIGEWERIGAVSLATWWAAYPQFLDPDNCPF